MECKAKEPAAIFAKAIGQANRELVRKAAEESRLLGMGTTTVIAALQDTHLWVANVGDSRLYLIHDKIHQVTRDHSLVEEMVQRGELEREAARVHPDKNIITRAVGATNEVAVDIFEVDLEPGTQVLMCSDGLNSMIDDEQILAIVKSQRDIAEQVEKLVEKANENGGKDNITVIMIDPFSGEV